MVAEGECKKEVKVGYCFIVLYTFGTINKCKQQIKRRIKSMGKGKQEVTGCRECIPIALQALCLHTTFGQNTCVGIFNNF